MNKADLVSRMAQDAGITKVAAEKALNSFMRTVKSSLSQSETIRLAGFGTYSVGRRAARNGRNPKTGERISIPAKKFIKFKPGNGLASL